MLYPHDPLQNGEVILTFDDGPELPCTEVVLQSLYNENVLATFFFVGYRARHLPDLARRVHDNGHSIGTHTNVHCCLPNIGSLNNQIKEIEEGICSIASALKKPPDPFFRFPFLNGSQDLERYLASRKIIVWDIDVETDDAFGIFTDDLVDQAIYRLRDRGRGVLLLHDIQPVTASVLPRLLRELKRCNFSIVHARST
jgi:peptidoglycan/xylan/chitin deacetylase (PgdA/CDA1 family)